ncbi:MAG: hypothetical protein LBE18_12305 [Planctomycetaceae bacterium]|jgi:hypothetical protein|nr:hypothetical protein [Planctomycetaceae bacterium]
MKILLSIFIVVQFIFSVSCLFGAELLSNEIRFAQEEKTVAAIVNPNADWAAVNREIERLEKMYENHPDMYVIVMIRIVNTFFYHTHFKSNRRFYEWSELIEKLNQKIFNKKPESNEGKGWQIEAIVDYMTFDPDEAPLEILTNRKIRVSKIIEIWQNVSNNIEHDWDRNDPKNILHPYSPPLSFTEGFKSGQSPDSIKDPIVKKEYTEYLEKRAALSKKAWDQKQAKEVVRKSKNGIKKYIIDSYSLRPFAAPELEQILKDNKVEEAFAKEILDAVKKAEKEAPPPSEFRNWQSKDGLFKAKAKFVSSDNKNVTLEKEDGKQTTIEISVLRTVDQRFVNEINSNSKSPKSD